MFRYDFLTHRNGRLVLDASLLTHDEVHQNSHIISKLYGSKALHNHINFNPLNYYRSGLDVDNSVQSRRLKRVFDPQRSNVIDFNRDPQLWGLGSIGSAIESGWDDVKSGGSSVVSDVSSGLSSVASSGSTGFSTVVGTVTNVGNSGLGGFHGFSAAHSFAPHKLGLQPFVASLTNFGHSLTSAMVSAKEWADEAWNQLSGEKDVDFQGQWPTLELAKQSGPFNASLHATPAISGSIRFTGGYIGAFNPTSIDLKFTPSFKTNGSISVGPQSTASVSFEGPSKSIVLPVLGTAEISSEMELSVNGTQGFKDGALISSAVTFDPSATFTLSSRGVGFDNNTSNPQTSLSFKNMVSGGKYGLEFVANPKITLSAGAKVPSNIPYIGGTSFATIDTTFENPIQFDMNSSKSEVDVSMSGELSSGFTFLGAEVSPAFNETTLYGPVHLPSIPVPSFLEGFENGNVLGAI